MREKKLVAVIEVLDPSFLKGRMKTLPAAINKALHALGITIRLERLFVLDAHEAAQVAEEANNRALPYKELVAAEKYEKPHVPPQMN